MAKNTQITKRVHQAKRFDYSYTLERLDCLFFGKKKNNTAGAFTNSKYYKRRLSAIIQKIRSRVMSVVTNDEDLKEGLLLRLDSLEECVSKINPNNFNEQEMIGNLFIIIGKLVGLNWVGYGGEFVRTPIYYQTEEQIRATLQGRANSRMVPGLMEAFERKQLINQFRSQGKSYSQIALILNLTESSVKVLEKAEHLNEMHDEAIQRINRSTQR